MDEYDAEAVALTMSKSAIADWVTGLDRAELMEIINLEPD